MTVTPRAKATGFLLAATIVAIAIGFWVVRHAAAQPALTRVGGAGNACTCTQRIEP